MSISEKAALHKLILDMDSVPFGTYDLREQRIGPLSER
jgi:hypothetical protein